MIVPLSWTEVRAVACLGIEREVKAAYKHRSQATGNGRARHDFGANPWGALGECVVAKALGVYWVGGHMDPDYGAPDVGPYHVRTNSRADGALIIRPRDCDNEPFVLVVCEGLPVFRIAGWAYGRDAKRDEFWMTPNDRPPAWFYPQRELRTLDTLDGWPR